MSFIYFNTWEPVAKNPNSVVQLKLGAYCTVVDFTKPFAADPVRPCVGIWTCEAGLESLDKWALLNPTHSWLFGLWTKWLLPGKFEGSMPLGPLLPVWCICLRSLDRQESSALHGQGLLWLGSDTELQLAGNSCLHSWQVAPSLPSGRSLRLAECHVHFPLWCHYPYHTPDGGTVTDIGSTLLGGGSAWSTSERVADAGAWTTWSAPKWVWMPDWLVDLGDLKGGYQSDSKWARAFDRWWRWCWNQVLVAFPGSWCREDRGIPQP